MPKNGKTKDAGRTAKSGRFVVSGMKKNRDGEEWTLTPSDKKGRSRTVVTHNRCAVSLDKITRKHGKALERLAKK